MVPIEALEKKTGAEQAEIAAYRNPKGELYLPATALQRAVVAAAAFSKGKGRASLQKQVAACVMIDPVYCLIDPQKYEVDARPVVIPSTKGRVLRYRPRFDEWQTAFSISADDTLINETELRRIIDDCGQRVGVLDFRPACKGPFGRFMVTTWKMV
jgi:hypothetical protein